MITGRPPKLTPHDVLLLRTLRAEGMDTRTLATKFEVDRSVVYDYLRGEQKAPDIAAAARLPL